MTYQNQLQYQHKFQNLSRDQIHAIRNKPFSTEDRILLSQMWKLDLHKRRLLDVELQYFCSLDTFLSHMEDNQKYPWQYIFKCDGAERGTLSVLKTPFNVNFFFCSGEYLFDLQEEQEEYSVSFSLRINISNKFYQCLVKVNKDDFDPNYPNSKYREFPVSRNIDTILGGDNIPKRLR
jgi:hypothetical protein